MTQSPSTLTSAAYTAHDTLHVPACDADLAGLHSATGSVLSQSLDWELHI